MATWENTTVTQNGQTLLNGLIAGTKSMTITRAVVGSGVVPVTELILQTEVSDQKQTMAVNSLLTSDEAVVIPVIISNIGLSAGYTAKQIGVYAQAEGEGEILFFIAQSDAGQMVPSETESPHGFTAEFRFTIATSNASELDITVDANGLLTEKIADELYAKKKATEDHISSKNNPHGVTAAQIGALTKAEADTLYSSGTHAKDKNNPHGVTAEQIGALTREEAESLFSNSEHVNDKNNPHGVTAEQIGALTEAKAKELFGAGVEPVLWEKGVNINNLGTGYFYLDAKLEEGDWEVMGLPEKYGAGWAGAYLVIKGNAGYGYEAYMRDFYDDTLWYTFLEGYSTTYWNQIFTDAAENIGKLIGAVPLDGSESMTGDLSIKKSYPRLELENTDIGRILAFLESDSYAQIANYLNTTNYRGIRIKPETAELESSVSVHEIVNGEVNDYKLYGEHNVTKGTTDLEAGVTPLGDGCIHLVHD